MAIRRLNPETLHHNPAFTQVAAVSGAVTLVFVGGQNGVDVEGNIVGGGLAGQTEQALHNLREALAAAGATFHDVVRMNIYLVQGQPLHEGYAVVQRFDMQGAPPPTISVLVVAGLANPGFLIEIDALAAVETGDGR